MRLRNLINQLLCKLRLKNKTDPLKSSIDLGTNTCLLLIAEVSDKVVTKVISDESTIVRLGEGVDKNKAFLDSAMERTLQCLEKYAKKVQRAGGDPFQTICVATASARGAENQAEFFEQVRERTEFEFKILSGQDEARLSFAGSVVGKGSGKKTVVDIGGGSTEIMSEHFGVSIDMGSVRFTERFLKSDPPTKEELDLCIKEIDKSLEQAPPVELDTELVAVAGTATNLAAWHLGLREWDREKVDEVSLSVSELENMVLNLSSMPIQERKALVGIEEKRADVILAGAMILWRTLKVLGVDHVQVSTRGLRYGVLTAF